jgi:hypothetical protein
MFWDSRGGLEDFCNSSLSHYFCYFAEEMVKKDVIISE